MLETLNINFKNDNRHLVVGSFRHNASAWTTLRASTYKGTQRMFSVKCLFERTNLIYDFL